MPAEIEQRLAALELPLPDPAFEQRLRAAVARPARRRRPGRLLAVALVLATCTASAAAFGASQVDNDLFGRLTHRSLVSNEFRVDPSRSVAGAKVAAALDCHVQGGSLACVPVRLASAVPSAYRLVERAATARYGPLTLFMLATGSTTYWAVPGLPPLIACTVPSATRAQICDGMTARSVLPRGTPIYENVTRP
ncbi:MAG TPA: hypothetical protein VGF46_00495 [Gaiellales bacterium]